MPNSNSASLHWDQRDGRVAAVAAAVVFSLWVMEMVLPGGGMDQGTLAAPDSALGRFLDTTHRMASILVLITAGLGLALGARRNRRWLTVSWWSMAVFGAASFTASLLPGRCVVSTDAACAVEALAEGAQGASVAQALIAVVTVLAALMGVSSLAAHRRRCGDRAWVFVAGLAVLQFAAAAGVLVLAGALYASAGDGRPGTALGLLERAHLVTVALWLLATGLLPGPWRRSRADRRDTTR